ncbi:MAG: hypothetical protein LBM26_01275 [Methanobrevibacter sp.]|nr:hypothetical protein [Methanobrevibacter sp.]
MKELEKDYQEGHISKEKYQYLHKEYQSRLATINATDKVRTMQSRKKPINSKTKTSHRNMADSSKIKDKDLVDKYVVNAGKNQKQDINISNKGKYAIIAVVFLIMAFMGGISFGLFNDFQATSPANVVVTINDSAFPEVESNVTKNVNMNSSSIDNSTNTDRNSDSDSNSDSNDDSDSNSNPTPSPTPTPSPSPTPSPDTDSATNT